MRLSLGVALTYLAAAILLGQHAAPISVAQQVIGVAAAAFLIAGLWTPVTATLAALGQIWIALFLPASQREGELIHILLGALCASLAMLGPGAWSIDARLFGRRRFPTHLAREERSHPPNG